MLAMRGGWRRACVGCLEAYTEAVDPRATCCMTKEGTGPANPNHKVAPDGWHDLLVQGGVCFCRQPPIRADLMHATRKCDRCKRLGEECKAGWDLPASWTEVEAPMWRMLEEGIDVFRQQARNVDRPMADKMPCLLQVLEMFYRTRTTAATGPLTDPEAPPSQILPTTRFPLMERDVLMCLRHQGSDLAYVED